MTGWIPGASTNNFRFIRPHIAMFGFKKILDIISLPVTIILYERKT
jgi:hypothetical protein